MGALQLVENCEALEVVLHAASKIDFLACAWGLVKPPFLVLPSLQRKVLQFGAPQSWCKTCPTCLNGLLQARLTSHLILANLAVAPIAGSSCHLEGHPCPCDSTHPGCHEPSSCHCCQYCPSYHTGGPQVACAIMTRQATSNIAICRQALEAQKNNKFFCLLQASLLQAKRG